MSEKHSLVDEGESVPLPSMREAMRSAVFGEVPKDRPTLEPCPLCSGEGHVLPNIAAEYRRSHGIGPELDEL